MKKVSLIIFLFASSYLFSQEASVEKSITGIQTGYLGIWIQNEYKLSNKFVLRSEIGLDAGLWDGKFYPKTGFILIPVITLEPKFYYNLDRRQTKGKRINNNSGNFISLQTSYHPRWFYISNYDNIETFNQFSIIPTYGLKRNIGKNFTFETGIGYGLSVTSKRYDDLAKIETNSTINLQLRLGYIF